MEYRLIGLAALIVTGCGSSNPEPVSQAYQELEMPSPQLCREISTNTERPLFLLISKSKILMTVDGIAYTHSILTKQSVRVESETIQIGTFCTLEYKNGQIKSVTLKEQAR